jgi:hypothetical protein
MALFATTISATALTYRMDPNEKACFFTDVGQKGSKIAFYFAVCFLSSGLFSLSLERGEKGWGCSRDGEMEVWWSMEHIRASDDGNAYDVDCNSNDGNHRIKKGIC